MTKRHDEGGAGASPRQLALFDLVPEPILDLSPAEVADDKNGGSVAGALREAPRSSAAPASEGDTPSARVRLQAVTLKTGIEEYKEYLVAVNRSKHTRESFGLDLKLLLEHLGNVSLTTIGERDLRSFVSWVRLQRQNSPTSVRRKIASLKNFFGYLHRERAIPDDPSLRLIYPETYPALPEFLEESKVEALLQVATEHDSWLALISLLLETGLKRDEAVALGRADVYLAEVAEESSYLVVRETEQAKRLRSRRLEISAEVTVILRTFAAGETPRERFFDLSPRGVNFIIETCGKRARIVTKSPKLTPQILRETFAVRRMRTFVAEEDRLRAAGATEDVVSYLMAEHDLQLLRLLGLHEEPESAKKYRKLVRGWTTMEHP